MKISGGKLWKDWGRRVFSLPIILILATACSEVRLNRLDDLELVSQNIRGFEANICPQSDVILPEKTKYLIVVDMSLSNIGGWDFDKGPNGNFAAYWNPSYATDYAGDRFAAIKTFLEGCGNQEGNEFAVIGFANTAGVVTTNAKGATSLECEANFGDLAKANTDLDLLSTSQETTKTWYERWQRPVHLQSNNWPGIMGVTSYEKALGCAENIITEDMVDSLDTNNKYHVLFMSDGSPDDGRDKEGAGEGCNAVDEGPEREKCYVESILDHVEYTMQASLARKKETRFHTIYYGGSDDDGASFLDIISESGKSGKASKLDTFAGNPDAICQVIINQLAIDYQPNFAAVVNLTTVRRNGDWLPDSDMDGLDDAQELALGYDPQNPRSRVAGILDGGCERLGGQSACEDRRNAVTCTGIDFNSMGLSDCDILALELEQPDIHPDKGIDTDRDGMPDFVEILKGSNPKIMDMSFDTDGDGFSNRKEILRGTDPYFKDSDIPETQVANYETRFVGPLPDSSNCENGAWKMSATFLPARPNLSTSGQPLEKMNHYTDAQVAMVFYSLSPRNSSEVTTRFFGHLVPIDYYYQERTSYDDSGRKIIHIEEMMSPIEEGVITEDRFNFLGAIAP